jgi:hypothetical protein
MTGSDGVRDHVQAWRADRRGRRLLDEGDGVHDLVFCGRGRVCWTRDGAPRSASLR